MDDQLVREACRDMRRKCIQLTYNLGSTGAHIGGTLSMIEIMAVLYLGGMHYDPRNLNLETRDRLILSKGHGAMAMYAAMFEAGILSEQQLNCFKLDESILSAHPAMNSEIGVEFSSGSLGQGLSLGVGVGIALKRKGFHQSKVFVVLGDGECNEGSVWEAIMSAKQFGLDNLVAIVDYNKLQYDGPCEKIISNEPFEKKWESFGWSVSKVDGHNIEALYEALNRQEGVPHVIIAETIKGKGVSFMENNKKWHNASLSKQEFELAMQEVG
jgi:transketolase